MNKLATVLELNTTLLRLDLEWNNLGAEIATRLAKILKNNCTLIELCLASTNLE